MQTFLTYPSFAKSARSLDQARLGKQRVECLQVLNVFAGVRKGWGNHPITKMWTGYELSLVKYGLTVCKVWRDEQGHADTCYGKIRSLFPEATMQDINGAEPPPWLGDPEFHRSHQSNLVRKAKQYYLHHNDRRHEPHNRCSGRDPHRPHRGCDPKLMWRHYRPQFPDVPLDLEYIWPV